MGGSNSQNLYYANSLWPDGHDIIFRGTEFAENLNLTFSDNNEDRSNVSNFGSSLSS